MELGRRCERQPNLERVTTMITEGLFETKKRFDGGSVGGVDLCPAVLEHLVRLGGGIAEY